MSSSRLCARVPPAESSSTAAGLPASSSASALLGGTIASASAKATHQILAKAQLSQELQLLFTRITECLVPNPTVHAVIPETPSSVPATPGTPAALNSAASSSRSEFSQAEKARQAALATLSNDPSLGELLPYLIRWLTENVNNALTTSASSSAAAATHQQQQAGKGQRSKGKETTRSTTEIGYLLDGINAVLSNEHLFVEPYVSSKRRFLAPPKLAEPRCSFTNCYQRSCRYYWPRVFTLSYQSVIRLRAREAPRTLHPTCSRRFSKISPENTILCCRVSVRSLVARLERHP